MEGREERGEVGYLSEVRRPGGKVKERRCY